MSIDHQAPAAAPTTTLPDITFPTTTATSSPLPTETIYRYGSPFTPVILDKIRSGRVRGNHYVQILLAVIALVSIVHWVSKFYTWRRLHKRVSSGGRTKAYEDNERTLLIPSSTRSFWVRTVHKLDSFLMHQPNGDDTETWGMTLFLALYILLTVYYSLFDACSAPVLLAFRLGKIATINTAFLFILGAKHSLLSLATGWSYEQVNVIHRWCGAIAVTSIVIHSAIFLYYFDTVFVMTNRWSFMGVVGGTAFTLIGVTSIKRVRLLCYEAFYAVHLLGSLICIPAVYWHYPSTKPYMVACGLSFAYDRIFRLVYDYRVVKCHMDLYPGDTVVMRIAQNSGSAWLHRPFAYAPGQHIFVTVFQCGVLESHPFTIASNPSTSDTLDLIVRARDGFSRRLYDLCVADGGDKQTTVVWGVIHGPYGAKPHIHDHADRGDNDDDDDDGDDDEPRVVLAAGGAGVAFTYPLFLEYIHFHPKTDVRFLWVVPWREFVQWVPELDVFDDARVHIWVTREQGRPNVPELVNELVDASHNCHIYACGPDPLIKSIRNTASAMRRRGQMVEYHAERFGW